MSDKFIAVLDKFIADPSEIKDIFRDGDEYYFRYGDHAFSIIRRASNPDFGAYTVYVYPDVKFDFQKLANMFNAGQGAGVKMVAYHEKGFPDANAKKMFPALYNLILEKYNNVDDLFDDILDK